MDDDQNTPSEPIAETPAPAPELAPTPVEPESSQPNGSTPTDLPSEAPESPISAPDPIPVESQNGGVNQPESDTVEPSNEPSDSEPVQSQSAPAPASAPAAQAPLAPQPQSPAQQDQTGFIRALLAKANAKIQSNKQKKLDKIILLAQNKKVIANEDVQRLLRVSDATATRYLVKLVQQGRLSRVGNPRDAKYQFLH
jgi:hypothetical protein